MIAFIAHRLCIVRQIVKHHAHIIVTFKSAFVLPLFFKIVHARTSKIATQMSSGPARPNACLRVGASALKNGFSASAVTLVPCLGSFPS
jgi:hypothetical protein